MAIALDRSKVYEYVLRDERALPPSEQTIFKLKPVSSRAWREVKSMMGKADQFGEYVHLLVSEGLVGWINFKSPDGQLIQFETDVNVNLDRLQEDWKNELATFLMNHSLLGEAEAVIFAARSQSPEA